MSPGPRSYMPCFVEGNEQPTIPYRFCTQRGQAGWAADTRPDAGNGSRPRVYELNLNLWMWRYGQWQSFLTIFSTHVQLRYWCRGVTPRCAAELTLLERYTFPRGGMLHHSLVFFLKQSEVCYGTFMDDITLGNSKACLRKIPWVTSL